MTRVRTYALIAALGIAGASVSGCHFAGGGELQEFDWGTYFRFEGSGGVLNRVRVVDGFDLGERRFSYYTGGQSGGSGESSPAPERIIAEGAHGAVTVRLRAFEPYVRENAAADAAELARIVSSATTVVWPGRPTPVIVDLHFIPVDVPFSLAKRVDWQEGDAYEIAMFARERTLPLGTAAHELYHVFAGRWWRGSKDPASAARPRAALAYEETTADLFAVCGRLLASESLARDIGEPSLVISEQTSQGAVSEQRFAGALDDEELARAFELLRGEGPGAERLGPFLSLTVLSRMFGDEETIVLDSPQGATLISWCRDTALNPMILEERLARD